MSSRLLTITFSFFILTTIILFTIFYNFQKNKYFSSLENRYISIAQIVIFSKMHYKEKDKEINKRLENFDIVIDRFDPMIYSDKNLITHIKYPKIKIKVYRHQKHFHLFISHMQQRIHLKDNGLESFNSLYYILFFIVYIGLLIIVYFTFIKKDIENKKARDIFVANIMHELKTPITKGKLTLTLLNDAKNTQRLDKVFHRMETLVNEFAFIEELVNSTNIQKNRYKLTDIVDNSIDLLLDECLIKKSFQERTIVVNYNLLSICIKNLLDNGIKYSDDKTVELINDEQNILIVKTKGKKLSKSLSFYTQAFSKEKQTGGFGLGLYIVKYILDFHKMKLEYSYENGYNYFKIV